MYAAASSARGVAEKPRPIGASGGYARAACGPPCCGVSRLMRLSRRAGRRGRRARADPARAIRAGRVSGGSARCARRSSFATEKLLADRTIRVTLCYERAHLALGQHMERAAGALAGDQPRDDCRIDDALAFVDAAQRVGQTFGESRVCGADKRARGDMRLSVNRLFERNLGLSLTHTAASSEGPLRTGLSPGTPGELPVVIRRLARSPRGDRCSSPSEARA